MTSALADEELDAVFFETIGTAEGRQDPYASYARLREAAVWRTGMGFVVCTRYEECQFVLRDPRFGKAEGDRAERFEQLLGDRVLFSKYDELLSRQPSLLFLNPPDHTRLRSLVSKAFTPRTVEQMRPEITSLVDGLLDRLPTDEVVDAMDLLAFPLPVAVIGRLLGVPDEDWSGSAQSWVEPRCYSSRSSPTATSSLRSRPSWSSPSTSGGWWPFGVGHRPMT